MYRNELANSLGPIEIVYCLIVFHNEQKLSLQFPRVKIRYMLEWWLIISIMFLRPYAWVIRFRQGSSSVHLYKDQYILYIKHVKINI
jgi:hypothetical protein